MNEKAKKVVKNVFGKFGFEIRKIRFEHDRFNSLEKTQSANCQGCSLKDIKADEGWENFKKKAAGAVVDSEIAKNPFFYTKRIMFELSNICNYSMIHLKCPINLMRDNPTILPSKIFYGCIDSLKKHEFKGEIAFHNYNEPLIDPRLFKFIEYIKKALPKNEIYICTNGFYLTQTMADELVEAGVTAFHVSVYFQKELKRFSKINFKVPFKLTPTDLLDNIISIYNGKELNLNKPCSAPFDEVIISRDGDVSLCCLDWKRVYTFGNLKDQALDQIVGGPVMSVLYKRLKKGDRFLEICKRCNQIR